MADGSGSEVQQVILFGNGLLSMSVGGRLHVYHNHMEIYYWSSHILSYHCTLSLKCSFNWFSLKFNDRIGYYHI